MTKICNCYWRRTFHFFSALPSLPCKVQNLSVIQFDAHADLRDQYQGTPFSHACVMRRIFSLNQRIVQLGIRALSKEEAKFIKSSSIKTWFAHQLYKGWSEKILHSLTENVYLTFDVDFLIRLFCRTQARLNQEAFFGPRH